MKNDTGRFDIHGFNFSLKKEKMYVDRLLSVYKTILILNSTVDG